MVPRGGGAAGACPDVAFDSVEQVAGRARGCGGECGALQTPAGERECGALSGAVWRAIFSFGDYLPSLHKPLPAALSTLFKLTPSP